MRFCAPGIEPRDSYGDVSTVSTRPDCILVNMQSAKMQSGRVGLVLTLRPEALASIPGAQNLIYLRRLVLVNRCVCVLIRYMHLIIIMHMDFLE